MSQNDLSLGFDDCYSVLKRFQKSNNVELTKVTNFIQLEILKMYEKDKLVTKLLFYQFSVY